LDRYMMHFLIGVLLIVLGIDVAFGLLHWNSNSITAQETITNEYYIK